MTQANSSTTGTPAPLSIQTHNSGLIQIADLPSPTDLGLPDKFTAFRKEQLLAYAVLSESKVPVQMACMGTGTGKSLTYATHAHISGMRTVILTASKGLQDQAVEDFASIGAVDMRGRANYKCKLHYTMTCETGSAAKCPYSGTSQCDYTAALERARRAQIVVTNYSYYMSSKKYAGTGRRQKDSSPNSSTSTDIIGLGSFDLMVCDEGHAVEQEICRFASMTLTNEHLFMLRSGRPPRVTIPGLQIFARQHLPTAQSQLRRYEEACKNRANDVNLAELTVKWQQLTTTLETMAADLLGNWAVQETEDRIVLEPLWASTFSRAMLFDGVKQIVIMSATLVPKTASLLGLVCDDYDFVNIPSPFPVAHTPIYYYPVTKVNKSISSEALENLYKNVATIINSRINRQGLVHTVSYARAHGLTAYMLSPRILTHQSGRETAKTIELFRDLENRTGQRRRNDYVMVSPSITTGYDFPGAICEFQIILKVPYPDMSNPVMYRRGQHDPTYIPYITAQEFVQMLGRGTRSMNDRCEVFLLDSTTKWFMYSQARDFIPPHVFRAFRTIKTIPKAPPTIEELAERKV